MEVFEDEAGKGILYGPRVAFHQGLQEVEVYSKECKLPESMAHIQVDSPGVAGTSGYIDRQQQEVEGDDHDFVGDERKYVIWKTVNSLFTLPLKLGTLVVLSLGQIVWDSEHFHDQHHNMDRRLHSCAQVCNNERGRCGGC
ncbi:unnamed protein product [Sphagnum troendelagicum]|uniref:Uncharacterized protein n=1 Tax=Sphagnum troendelagicum TaxID=128251 RepID=A0ABP0UQ02_9BRYO